MTPTPDLKAAALAAWTLDIKKEQREFREEMAQIDWTDLADLSNLNFIAHYHREFQVWLAAKRSTMGAKPIGWVNADYVESIRAGRRDRISVWRVKIEGQIPVYTAPPSTDEKDAERYRGIRSLIDAGDSTNELISAVLDSVFPENDERDPTPEEFDAVVDAVLAALEPK